MTRILSPEGEALVAAAQKKRWAAAKGAGQALNRGFGLQDNYFLSPSNARRGAAMSHALDRILYAAALLPSGYNFGLDGTRRIGVGSG